MITLISFGDIVRVDRPPSIGLHAFTFRSDMRSKNYELRALCTLIPCRQLACDEPRTRCQPIEAAGGSVDL